MKYRIKVRGVADILRIFHIHFIISAILILSTALACDGKSLGDWGDLPGYLHGGVVIYGDSRTGDDVHRWLVKGMAVLAPEAVFHTGDLVSDGRVPAKWVTFNDIISQLPPKTPLYPALGNHEHGSSLYFDNFDLPGNERWYVVDTIKGYRFIVLDTEADLSPGSAQYHWLENKLSRGAPEGVYTIMIFHYPLFSTGRHGSAGKGLADDLVPLFEKYGVDAVFSGHDHDYERSTVNGIRYIVTGGGGAPLRGQSGTSVLSDLFVKAHHFCVLYRNGEGKLMVEVWSDKVERIDGFEIENR